LKILIKDVLKVYSPNLTPKDRKENKAKSIKWPFAYDNSNNTLHN